MHWKLFNTYVSAYVNTYTYVIQVLFNVSQSFQSLQKKSKLAQSLLDHTHIPLKFDQVSLHKTWKIFKMILDGALSLPSRNFDKSKASFWKPAWEHSVVHWEPGLVELEQVEISIKVFRGRFIEAFIGFKTFPQDFYILSTFSVIVLTAGIFISYLVIHY